jgi:hypothetical protein
VETVLTTIPEVSSSSICVRDDWNVSNREGLVLSFVILPWETPQSSKEIWSCAIVCLDFRPDNIETNGATFSFRAQKR